LFTEGLWLHLLNLRNFGLKLGGKIVRALIPIYAAVRSAAYSREPISCFRKPSPWPQPTLNERISQHIPIVIKRVIWVAGSANYDRAAFGLTNVTNPCWTGSFTSATSGSVCSTPNSYLFWDQVIRPQWQMLRRLGGYALAALTRIAEEPSLPDGANQRAIRAHPGRRQRRGAGHEVRCRRARLASSIKHCVTLPGHVQKSWQRTRRTPPQDRPSTGMDFVYSETPSCLVRLSPVHWPPT
jgi:hypothetical protein